MKYSASENGKHQLMNTHRLQKTTYKWSMHAVSSCWVLFQKLAPMHLNLEQRELSSAFIQGGHFQ